MDKERMIKNLRVIADAYEKSECLYCKFPQWHKSGFDHLESLGDNLDYLFIDTIDYITESEYNKIKYQDLVGKWLLSKDENTKHKITKVNGYRVFYGHYNNDIEFVKEHYTLENGEEI